MADKSIEIKITTDARQSVESFLALTKGLRDTQNEFRSAQEKVSALAKEMASAGGRVDHLGIQIALSKKHLADLSAQGLSKTHVEYQALAGEIATMEAELKRHLPALQALEKEHSAAARAASSLQGKIDQQTKSLDKQTQILTGQGIQVANLAKTYEAATRAQAGWNKLSQQGAQVSEQLARRTAETAKMQRLGAAAAAAAAKDIQDALNRSQAAWNKLFQQGALVAEAAARRNAEAAKLRALSAYSASPVASAGGGQSGMLRDIKTGMDSISGQLALVRAQILQAFSVSIIADKGREVIALADSMRLLDARIELATTSLGEFRAARAGIVEIAQPLGAELEQVGGGFTRIANAIRQYRGTAAQALQLTEIVTASAKLSGAATYSRSGARKAS